MKIRQHLHTLIIVLLLAIFFFTGMDKIWHHNTFVIMLKRQPLPLWMLDVLEWGVPIAEMAVVLLLVIPQARLLGLWSAAIMMLAFTGYTIYAATEPYGYVPCACGKLMSSLSWAGHTWVNMILTALAGVGIWLHRDLCKNNEANGDNSQAHQHSIAQAPG